MQAGHDEHRQFGRRSCYELVVWAYGRSRYILICNHAEKHRKVVLCIALAGWLTFWYIGIDDPITDEAPSTEPSAEQLELLTGMGFSQAQAKKALRETVSAATMKDAGAKHKLVTYYDFF